MECREVLIAWLNNAYAMEKSMAKTLRAHAEDAAKIPDYQQDLLDHVDETEEQAERVKEAIESLGGDVSRLKQMGGEMMGLVEGVMAEGHKDKIIKNAIAEHAAEHFEMATYMAIAEAARICGEDEVEKMAMSTMKEETQTGEKLEKTLKKLVDFHLSKEA
jgi:ferritin-like metal-binding protein YciE